MNPLEPLSDNRCVQAALTHAQQSGLPRLDAQMLLLHSLGQSVHDRAWLLSHSDAPISTAAWAHFQSLMTQRLQQVPLAYLIGHKEFFGLTLNVDARVLDPRADTEILVEWSLDCLQQGATPPRVLDLGTGSGAIALALGHHVPHAQVWAVDASTDALTVAQANAHRLGLAVHFLHGHWFEHWTAWPLLQSPTPLPSPRLFDLIVSNPPYIASDDPHLASLTHEPLSALAAGDEGLDDLRVIIAQAPHHLTPGGWLLLEHGWEQAFAVQNLLRERGFVDVQSRVDLAGIQRVSGGQWLKME